MSRSRKHPAAVALGRRGGRARSEKKAVAVRANGRLRPLGRHEERRALVAGRLPCVVRGYAPDGRHVATWHLDTAGDAEMFSAFASAVFRYELS